MYISQDPISIAGGLNVYGYVHDSNSYIDPKLYKCLGKYLTTHDKIIGGITDESIRKMASTLNYGFSHGLNTFFTVVSKIYLEGVEIDFEELREFEVNPERYIVLGEFWLEKYPCLLLYLKNKM